MRTLPYIFAVFAAIAWIPGCSDDPSRLTGGPGPAGADDGDPGGAAGDAPEATPAEAPAHDATFGERTLSRARAWIAAKMPYCGGPNGGHDLICGGTCVRTGSADKTEWDPYRSDCSGFVSWSWGLPAPGETTSTLAPYATDASVLVKVDDLQPGDALNSGHHVMLFGGWVDANAGTATVLQESRCGTEASEKVATFERVDATTLRISDGRTFRSIRARAALGR